MWEDKIPVDTKEFVISPEIRLLRNLDADNVREQRSIKLCLGNLLVSDGQVLTLEIVDGFLRVRVFLKGEP